MITNEQMEEWIKEVEERPASGPIIVRFVANRLRDLSKRNEELLAENIELRTGQRVEEYESRITNLEYQLDLLKRQVGGGLNTLTNGLAVGAGAAVEAVCVVLYTPTGQVLRVDQPVDGLESGNRIAKLAARAENTFRVLVTNAQEELLFVFDSGRSSTLAVSELTITAGDALDWKDGYPIELRAGEQLATVLPIGKMALADVMVQASRRGCVKKVMRPSFESHLAKNYIGTGVAVKTDQTCCLALSSKDDRFVLASREGFLVTLEVSRLPFTTEESFRIGPTDYIVSGFVLGSKPSILAVTHNGKAIHREAGWLEAAATSKSRGQPVFSQSRREAGVRVVGAAAVAEEDWGVALHRDGTLTLHAIAALLADGAISGGSQEPDLIDFTVFTPAVVKK